MSATFIDATGSRIETLRAEVSEARRQTDLLFSLVSEQTLYARPIPQRHRLVFYVGHVEAFDWNLLRGPERPFHGSFDRLFAFGIDPDQEHLPRDEAADWPRLEEIRSYVRDARARVDRLLGSASFEMVSTTIEHRLMHAETLAYLLHHLPCELKRAPSETAVCSGPGAVEIWRRIPAGDALLGQHEKDGFGWDNEFEPHSVHVPAFQVSRYKVTNRDYLAYVREGAPAPNFWENLNGQWQRRGMFDTVPLPLDEPVYVTQEQAASYASWRGKRLLTEAEFHRAATGAQPAATNFESWNPAAVSAFPESASVYGVEQLIGNGWEWTSTPFAPFPDFRPRDYYAGYSQDFFDHEHFVLKGGSVRTANRLLRPSFRNWFRRDYPYAYAAFRLAENE